MTRKQCLLIVSYRQFTLIPYLQTVIKYVHLNV